MLLLLARLDEGQDLDSVWWLPLLDLLRDHLWMTFVAVLLASASRFFAAVSSPPSLLAI